MCNFFCFRPGYKGLKGVTPAIGPQDLLISAGIPPKGPAPALLIGAGPPPLLQGAKKK